MFKKGATFASHSLWLSCAPFAEPWNPKQGSATSFVTHSSMVDPPMAMANNPKVGGSSPFATNCSVSASAKL